MTYMKDHRDRDNRLTAYDNESGSNRQTLINACAPKIELGPKKVDQWVEDYGYVYHWPATYLPLYR